MVIYEHLVENTSDNFHIIYYTTRAEVQLDVTAMTGNTNYLNEHGDAVLIIFI